MKKNLFLLLISISFVITANAQGNGTIDREKYSFDDQIPAYMELQVDNDVDKMKAVHQGQSAFLKKILGLNNETTAILVDTLTDISGGFHESYEEYYQGVKVEGTRYNVHYNQEGDATLINGNFRTINQLGTIPNIDEKSALQTALQYIAAERYSWEDDGKEQVFQSKTSYYPKGEIVILVKEIPKLTYKFYVSSVSPSNDQIVYVDAMEGEVLEVRDARCSISTSVITRYSGQRTIETQYNPGSYRLRDYTRGNGIETYKYSSRDDYTSTDNSWTNLSTYDRAALDAHWGLEKSYDFYYDKFGRNSYNNQGAKLKSYVNMGAQNAYWDERDEEFSFGQDNNIPFVSLDIVSHEYTHAFTSATSQLATNGEAGALNEGLSDAFAVAIEKYGKPTSSNSSNWCIGEELSGGPLRNLTNPDCKYYQGVGWINPSSNSDSGGVHTNCGVFTYWFYLLVNGGTGVNQSGINVPVEGIGMDMALQICYLMNSSYLTSNSTFSYAKKCSYWAAQALGYNDNVIDQIRKAWFDVGVEMFSDSRINGSTVVGNSSTYFVNDIPSDFNVTWSVSDSYYQNALQQNYPTTNKCTIARNNSHEMSNATLTAQIYYNGNVVKTLTKSIYAFTGFRGTYYNGQTTKNVNLPNPLYVLPNTLVIINSLNIIGAGLSYSGATPTDWIFNNSQGVLKVGMPSSNNSTISVSVNCENGDSFTLPIVVTTNTGFLSFESAEGRIIISIKDCDGFLNDGKKLVAEIYNVQTGESVAYKEIVGKSLIIETSNLATGIYLIRASVGDEVVRKKIVIK